MANRDHLSICSSCFLFMHMSSIKIYEVICVHLAAGKAFFCFVWLNFHCLTVHGNGSTKFFHTCRTFRHHGLLPFHATFRGLDLAHQVVKCAGFIFYTPVNCQVILSISVLLPAHSPVCISDVLLGPTDHQHGLQSICQSVSHPSICQSVSHPCQGEVCVSQSTMSRGSVCQSVSQPCQGGVNMPFECLRMPCCADDHQADPNPAVALCCGGRLSGRLPCKSAALFSHHLLLLLLLFGSAYPCFCLLSVCMYPLLCVCLSISVCKQKKNFHKTVVMVSLVLISVPDNA